MRVAPRRSQRRRSVSVKMRSRKRSPNRSIALSMRRMSIRSLPTPRITGGGLAGRAANASTARPLDRVDDRGGAQGGDDRRQMLHVGDLDIDHDLEKISRA